MNSTITDNSAARAERLFRMHLAMFTDPAMTQEAYANLWTEDAVHEYPYAPAPYSRLSPDAGKAFFALILY